MGKITKFTRLKNYYKLFEQLHTDYGIQIYKLAQKTGLSRNTVSKYLDRMYEKGIIIGPYLEMKSSEWYKEYVYLMEFHHPNQAYTRLMDFPCVHHSLAAGDWNIAVTSSTPLDVSQLVGFKKIVHQGIKYKTYTPKNKFFNWDKCFEMINCTIREFSPYISCKQRVLSQKEPWNQNEWKLFFAFKDHIRKKKTPVLQEIDVQYEKYTPWINTVEEYCSINCRFYPEGYTTYEHQQILLESSYEEQLKKIFSLFPTTPVFTEVGNSLLIDASIITSPVALNLICSLLDMKTVNMVKDIKTAQLLSEYTHK